MIQSSSMLLVVCAQMLLLGSGDARSVLEPTLLWLESRLEVGPTGYATGRFLRQDPYPPLPQVGGRYIDSRPTIVRTWADSTGWLEYWEPRPIIKRESLGNGVRFIFPIGQCDSLQIGLLVGWPSTPPDTIWSAVEAVLDLPTLGTTWSTDEVRSGAPWGLAAVEAVHLRFSGEWSGQELVWERYEADSTRQYDPFSGAHLSSRSRPRNIGHPAH